MTTLNKVLKFLLVLVFSVSMLTACGGKKSAAETPGSQQAAPTNDITYPPTIEKPEPVSSDSDDSE